MTFQYASVTIVSADKYTDLFGDVQKINTFKVDKASIIIIIIIYTFV